MKLDYGTRMSYSPIATPYGLIRKPTLEDCTTYPMSFDKFNAYESMLLLTPELFFTEIAKGKLQEIWESLSAESKENMSLYDLITIYSEVANEYREIFDFFFLENVIYDNGVFFTIKPDKSLDLKNITEDDIVGVIGKDEFAEVVSILQRICCIGKEEESVENLKFKNDFQRKLYMDYLATVEAEEKEQRKNNHDNKMVLPNIISAVANKHPSLNYTNIWKLTIFQLFDTFDRLQANAFYDMGATRTSVWGDEKKTFDSALWYKNNYEDNKSAI